MSMVLWGVLAVAWVGLPVCFLCVVLYALIRRDRHPTWEITTQTME